MGETAAQAATLTVDPDPGVSLTIRNVEMTEELGRPFLATLIVVAADASAALTTDLTAILGGSATVSVARSDGSTQYVNGIVARCSYLGTRSGGRHYHIELRPWIWLLGQQSDCVIYQNQSVWALITTLFRNAGFTDYQDKRQNQAGSTVLPYCVQYNETTLDFVTRLLETWGLYYFVTHANGSHTVVFADNPSSHTSVGTLSGDLEGVRDSAAIGRLRALTSEQMFTAGQHTLDDYNFTTPSADLTAREIQAGSYAHASLGRYEYPGGYAVAADGTTLAGFRLQPLVARRKLLRGETDAIAVQVGTVFTLADFPDRAANVEYLVTGAAWSLGVTGTSDGTGGLAGDYGGSIAAIPNTVPFALDRRTPRPRVAGPQTATVVGASGQEISTEQYGRIKVRFVWDRSGSADTDASCWIRVAQNWAGAAFGGMVIPRVGMEVVVEFLHGDPDQPIVTGCVYNATNTVPYALPDNATRSTFKTNSSTGGGGFNELRFEDKAGSEEVFLQAQKDLNVTVGNNRAVTVTQADSLTVSKGDRTVTVSEGGDTLTVTKGDLTVSVSQGAVSVTANKSITLTVGENSLVLNTSGLTVTAGSVTITADEAMSVSAASVSIATEEAFSATAGGEMTLAGTTVMIN